MTVVFQNRISELERLQDAIKTFAREHELSDETAFEINLALDELLTNTISYGYADDSRHDIRLSIRKMPDSIRLDLEDDGVPFDPTKREKPDVEKAVADRKIGGLGIFLVKKMMDNVNYRRERGRNITTLLKLTGCETDSPTQ